MSQRTSVKIQKADNVTGDNESGSVTDSDTQQLVIRSSRTEGSDLAEDDAFGITVIIGNVDLK